MKNCWKKLVGFVGVVFVSVVFVSVAAHVVSIVVVTSSCLYLGMMMLAAEELP